MSESNQPEKVNVEAKESQKKGHVKLFHIHCAQYRNVLSLLPLFMS